MAPSAILERKAREWGYHAFAVWAKGKGGLTLEQALCVVRNAFRVPV